MPRGGKRAGAGRKPRADGRRATRRLAIGLTEVEFAGLAQAARRFGVSVLDFARVAANYIAAVEAEDELACDFVGLLHQQSKPDSYDRFMNAMVGLREKIHQIGWDVGALATTVGIESARLEDICCGALATADERQLIEEFFGDDRPPQPHVDE